MILFPPAKINLGLNVLSKRSDGYHEIETCMLEVPLCDVLEILPSERYSFISTGIPIQGDVEDNLCTKAFRLLETEHKIAPVYIHLRKNIPMGAGLGGGSADATYVLKGLNDLFELELSQEQLEIYSAQLGSDCPFFVAGGAQLASGRGEELSKFDLDFKGKFIKLVNPEIHIGTAEAYTNVEFVQSYSIEEVLNTPIAGWQERLKNSFESYAFRVHPEIELIKRTMLDEGAIYAAMSGSGSTVFGIYDKKPNTSFDCELEWVLGLF